MNFKKVFRGYDPEQVDKYIADNSAKEQSIRVSQRERIDQLTDENYALRQRLTKYQAEEQAISKSLIASQNLAEELKFDAQKYSNMVLSRAKIFYATWRAYAQTLIGALSDDEVRQFNELQKKLEDVINAYEGKDVASEVTSVHVSKDTPKGVAATSTSNVAVSTSASGATRPAASSGARTNPISKIESAAEHAINLDELSKTDLSLEELCKELGLNGTKNNKR